MYDEYKCIDEWAFSSVTASKSVSLCLMNRVISITNAPKPYFVYIKVVQKNSENAIGIIAIAHQLERRLGWEVA